MMKDKYKNGFGYLIMFSICLIAVILMGLSVRGYSTYGAPSEFGNLTATTCYIGGDDGIITCDGDGIIGGSITAVNFIGSGENLTGIISGRNLSDDPYLYSIGDFAYWNESYGNLTIAKVKVDNCTWADGASITTTNSSNYWDGESSQSDLNVNSSNYWDGESSQSDLNVNSSNYWDNRNTAADINAGDITDDNTYCTTSGETILGNFVFDDGAGESPKITFINANDNESSIYEQADGDLYLKANDGFELAGTSYRMTTLINCNTIDTSSTGVLSCGTDETISNCSTDQSCSAIVYNTDEGNLNTNSSIYWNDENSQSNLNVNDTDYFDGIDSSSFVRSDTTDTISANMIMDDNSGESPKWSWVNENEDKSYIYEQTTGDLRIEAANNLEMETNADYVFQNLTNCDTIDTDASGHLSCGNDDLLEDTTPQLGGYLDANGNNMGTTDDEIENTYIGTSNKIYLGDGQEGEIYFDGSKLVIKVN